MVLLTPCSIAAGVYHKRQKVETISLVQMTHQSRCWFKEVPHYGGGGDVKRTPLKKKNSPIHGPQSTLCHHKDCSPTEQCRLQEVPVYDWKTLQNSTGVCEKRERGGLLQISSHGVGGKLPEKAQVCVAHLRPTQKGASRWFAPVARPASSERPMRDELASAGIYYNANLQLRVKYHMSDLQQSSSLCCYYVHKSRAKNIQT
ncbi:hypothetical protein HNY73_020950 [Argiope bruennichi]|uniref:Uncharacterized protein n=1 Tax=Argiope bruennichi TaxID=94029 RepID=A0A8T0E9S2_ARGBR|nr:hypothetical protein HNY73_020950 [Argiope bruennichi]